MIDLKVNHGGLDVAAADLDTAASRLEVTLRDLESGLNARQVGWSGAAKDAYLPAKAEWNAAISAMRLLLLHLGRAVAVSNEAYAAADLAGSHRFR
ncbi:putative ESAT-6-like protein [metagenome]|uniref:Putative ESAT-6-like protein n=1 Tax=metagenome TaxID=256318 RepID=A0A2P2CF64_9ZZZZ